MISYEPFFKTLKRKKIKQIQLINLKDDVGNIFSTNLFNKIKHNKYISTYSIDKLCKVLKCDINDICCIL